MIYQERQAQARPARAPASLPSLADLRPLIEARAADFRRAFEADPETMRRRLRAFLGQERIAVREDDEKGFAVEGWLSLLLMQQTPGISQDPGRLQRVVARERYAPKGTERNLVLPLAA